MGRVFVKRIIMVFVVGVLLLLCGSAYPADITTSQPTVGSGNSGFFLNLGYDGNYMEKKYYTRSGNYNGKDTGWLYGGEAEARFETQQLWTRGRFEYNMSDGITFTSPSGVKSSHKVKGDFQNYEFAVGYKALNFVSSTLTPYAGVGYRHNENKYWASEGTTKIWYNWGYVPIGLNFVYNFGSGTIGADAAVQIPFAMKAHGSNTSVGVDGSADISSGMGFRVEIPFTFDIFKPQGVSKAKVFGLLTPYYQYWQHDASDNISGTTTYFTEARTHFFGIKAGIGVNF
jgi:hypothetical protein